MKPLFAGIEAGGTKFVCAVGTGPDDLRAETRFPTTNPEETLNKAVDFFRNQEQKFGKIDAIGVAAFGPIDPDPKSATYGYITSTPKPGWKDCNLVGALQQSFSVPIGFDTDVNVAAYGEWRFGAGRGKNLVLYMTIGTGVGGGVVVNGEMLHGLIHPEIGHMLLPQDKSRDPFEGNCPFHGNCLEGLASGPAIHKRWGVPAEELPTDHPAWALEAEYLSTAVANLICILSPQIIILGGGVLSSKVLFPLIRNRVEIVLNGYVQTRHLADHFEHYIVPPFLGNRAGVVGSLALAEKIYLANPSGKLYPIRSR